MKCTASVPRVSAISGARAIVVLACLVASQATAQAHSSDPGRDITLQNQLVTLNYHSQFGTMDIVWQDGHKLLGITSSVHLEDGRLLSTGSYAEHELVPSKALANSAVAVGISGAREYTIRSTASGMPALLQHIWLYDGKPWIAIEAELSPEAGAIGTRHFDAVVFKGASAVQLGNSGSLRVLHVPFDNEMWFRYISFSTADMKSGQLYTSDEVTAIYDN